MAFGPELGILDPTVLGQRPWSVAAPPGGTVGECARQAQSGARAGCCTRSWVLRGLGSCRHLPSPQQNSSAAAKLRESEQGTELRFIRPSCLELQENTGSRGGAVFQVSTREMCRSGASFMKNTRRGHILYGSTKLHKRERRRRGKDPATRGMPLCESSD